MPVHSTSSQRTGSRRLTIGLFTFTVFLYWISLYTYVPTLPVYVESKSDNLALVGVVLSMYGLWQLIIRLPLGIASDWLGWRKPFIVVGFALAGLGAWILGRADGVNSLILGRAVTGLAAGTWVPLIVVFSSLFPPNEAVRATAILTFVGSVGRVLATGSTGLLNQWGGYPLAYFVAAGAAGLALVIVLMVPEKRRAPKTPSLSSIGSIVSRRDVLIPALLSAVAQYANWASTFGFMPLLANQLGATDVTQSMLLSMNIGVMTVGNLATSAIATRIGNRKLVMLSFGLLSAGVGGAALASTLPQIFAAQFCIGLSMGIGYPVLMGMSIEKVEESQRTTAMGLHQAVYAIGMFGGPWVSGMLADAVGIRPTFVITATLCLFLGVLGTRWLQQQSSPRPAPERG